MSEALARDLLTLAGLFKAGGWRELRVEAEGLGVLFSADPATAGLGGAIPQPRAASSAVPSEPRSGPSDGAEPATLPEGWTAVAAPNLGTFYRSPKPGAPPFVEVGQRVAADAEICLLEVMKLFTSVKAGVAGVVRRVCVGDGELVEQGRVLFHVEPG